ncbi:hypothetical protein FDUTEX481_04053 [Tolypothrix sp. PCC 7601]|nr:hypothetical protein FDUTEX481_04053 [Tolypothrix sp. PCC 7601]
MPYNLLRRQLMKNAYSDTTLANTCRLRGKRGMGKGKEKTFNP